MGPVGVSREETGSSSTRSGVHSPLECMRNELGLLDRRDKGCRGTCSSWTFGVVGGVENVSISGDCTAVIVVR